MTKHFRKNYFVLALSFLVLLLVPNLTFACSCEISALLSGKTERQLIKLERKKSKAVFAGEVTEIVIPKTASGEDSWSAEVHFKVLQTWKGVTTETISVSTVNVCCICGYKFAVGERYLVYAYSSGKGLGTNICTRTKPLSEADKDLKMLGKNNISSK